MSSSSVKIFCHFCRFIWCISSTRLQWSWNAGVTQRPHEHWTPHQLKEPSFDLHFGHKSCPSMTPSKAGSIHWTGSIKYEVHCTRPDKLLDFLCWKAPSPNEWLRILECRNSVRRHFLQRYDTSEDLELAGSSAKTSLGTWCNSGNFSVILVSLYCLYNELDVSTSHCILSYRHSCSSKPGFTWTLGLSFFNLL